MTNRRPHWDDTLVEAVYVLLPYGAGVEDAYAIIAVVEDWQRENLHWPRTVETCEQAERLRSESDAAIKRVRELANSVANYHGEGLPRIKPRDIYRALEQEETEDDDTQPRQ